MLIDKSVDQRPGVLIFRLQLFKPSETFIAAQASTYQRYRPIFVGFKQLGPAPDHVEYVKLSLKKLDLLRLLLGDGRPMARAIASRPVLVHAHFAVDAVFAIPLARALKVPLVVTLHGFDVTTALRTWLFSGKPALILAAIMRKRVIRVASRFYAVSSMIRNAAIRKSFPAERTHVAYLGIDTIKLVPAPLADDGLIVHVGRLVEKKGSAHLLASFAGVIEKVSHARLSLIGDGPLRVQLEKQSEALGLSSHVTFHGALPHQSTLEIMRRAQVVAVPSVTASDGDREGLPTVILEAAAMAKPVVATIHSGIPEVVQHGKTGLLVAERDEAALTNSLVELLSEPKRARLLGLAARNMVERSHNARLLTPLLEKDYDRVVAAGVEW